MEQELIKKIEENHIIFIKSELTLSDASNIIFRLMNWGKNEPDQEIKLFVSSECHVFTNIIAIYDVLKTIPNPISVYCIGKVAGFAVILLAAANKKSRYILKHTVITLEQPVGFVESGPNQETELSIESNNLIEERKIFEEIMSESFNIDIKKLHELCDDDTELDAKEALKLGLVDYILE